MYDNFLHLRPYLDKFPEKAVLIVGDIMLDRFVYGTVERISPESPVPVLSIQREDVMLGGAGNVLSNLAGLGVQGRILTVVGDDSIAAQVGDLVEERKGNRTGLIVDPARPTTIKTRFLAAHQQLLRTDFEKKGALSPATEERLCQAIAEQLPAMQAVILSDYGKGVLTPAVIKAVIDTARAHDIPVLVDPKGRDYSIYEGASVVTPNRKELAEATGDHPTDSDEDIIKAAEYLLQDSGIDSIVVTRSEKGMTIWDKAQGRAPVHIPTQALEVFDVSGAGDTVIATLAAALASGASLEEAAHLSNLAGGIVVAKVGTAAIRREELNRALTAGGPRDVIKGQAFTMAAPVCKADEAREQIQRWKAQGLTVGFTNGCFDIIHYGHVNYLNRAREKCDRLVVGLNSDASIKRLKGLDRPVNEETARASVIGALGAIDMVVMFGDAPEDNDTPCNLIRALQPDMFFKGGDYREDQLPEAPIVKSYGGQVKIMPLYDGHSTTRIIARVQGAQ